MQAALSEKLNIFLLIQSLLSFVPNDSDPSSRDNNPPDKGESSDIFIASMEGATAAKIWCTTLGA